MVYTPLHTPHPLPSYEAKAMPAIDDHTERTIPWITLAIPDTSLRLMGELIAQWALFEREFTGIICLLREHPQVREKHPNMPKRFIDKIKCAKFASRTIFSKECPQLKERIYRLSNKCIPLKTTRDAIAHCVWTGDLTSPKLHGHNESSGKTFAITVDILLDTTIKISALTRESMSITHTGMPFNDFSFHLSGNELESIKNFK